MGVGVYGLMCGCGLVGGRVGGQVGVRLRAGHGTTDQYCAADGVPQEYALLPSSPVDAMECWQ